MWAVHRGDGSAGGVAGLRSRLSRLRARRGWLGGGGVWGCRGGCVGRF